MAFLCCAAFKFSALGLGHLITKASCFPPIWWSSKTHTRSLVWLELQKSFTLFSILGFSLRD